MIDPIRSASGGKRVQPQRTPLREQGSGLRGGKCCEGTIVCNRLRNETKQRFAVQKNPVHLISLRTSESFI